MSVQALSGDELNRAGITRLYELQFAVPGLVVNTVGMFGAGFSLRGIADQLVGGMAVAPYLDGVYLGNANLALARMFDLERVEVLKGPQGTLYGRNSTGGSINFITRSPQDVFSAEVEGSYGSFETTRVQGHVNVPLEKNALRLAFIASEGDGYIRNSVDDRTFGEEDFWGVRAALRIHSTDNLDIDVMAQHIRDDGASAELWTPNPRYLVDRNDIRLTTVTLANPYLISEIDNLAINLSYDLEFATLRSITGYARSKIRNLDDCAGMPGCWAASERRAGAARAVEPGAAARVCADGLDRRTDRCLLRRCRSVREFLSAHCRCRIRTATYRFSRNGERVRSGSIWPDDVVLSRTLERDRRCTSELGRESR